ncbi:ATP-binding protein [Paraburkholderia sp. 2C]
MTEAAGKTTFRIDLTNLCVWRTTGHGAVERVKLARKTFDVLRYLVEHGDRLVTHEELLEAVWPDTAVQQEVLKSHILAIRSALAQGSDGRHFIETQRGRGYRFVGSFDSAPHSPPPYAAAEKSGAFVGRGESLSSLLNAFQQAVSGRPRTVFISGEPGIGKTALIHQFLEQAQRLTKPLVGEGHCIEGFAGIEPYYPILEALGELCKGPGGAGIARTLLALAPAWAVQMPAQFPADQRAAIHPQLLEGARGRMLREATNLVETLAAVRPLVLVLEDLQWADYATIDFLSAVCRRRSNAKLMLIGTYRAEEAGPARHPLKRMASELAARQQCIELRLGPLPAPAIAEVLQGGPQGEPASAPFVRFLHDRCGGNPLFMRITLDHLVEQGIARHTTHGWQLVAPLDRAASEPPPTLGRLIESRLDTMTDDQLRVLEAASVAGDRFDPASASAAAGMDTQAFEAVCEQLVRDTGVIRHDELLSLPDHEQTRLYAFTHTIYRQVVYHRIAQMRSARLHRAIGEQLEALYPSAQRKDLAVRLAQHFACARDWPRSLDYLRSALTVANTRYARFDALSIVDRALEMISHLPDSERIPANLEFLERRAAIQAASHDPHASATYRQLADQAKLHGDTNMQIRALLGLTYVLSWHDLHDSLRKVDEVLALCDRLDDPLDRDLTRVTAHVRRIWVAGWSADDAHRCEAALARLRAHADRRTTAQAEAAYSMLCMLSTRYQEAHDLLIDSYRVLRENSEKLIEVDLVRLAWMHDVGVPWALFSRGEFGAGLDALDASILAFEENGEPLAVRPLRVYRGMLLFHAMDFEGVLQACESVASPETGGSDETVLERDRVLPVDIRISMVFCGLAEAGLGHCDAALRYLRRAEQEMERQPVHLDWYWCLPLRWGRVRAYLAAGDYACARREAERLVELAMRTDELTWQALAWNALTQAAFAADAASREIDGYLLNALAACAKASVPLAEWRVHATAAAVFAATGDHARATAHADSSTLARQRIAQTLPQAHRLRVVFESRSASTAFA